MIGAGTLRVERYGRLVPDPDQRARRERDGLPPDPSPWWSAAGSTSPWDASLFTDDASRC